MFGIKLINTDIYIGKTGIPTKNIEDVLSFRSKEKAQAFSLLWGEKFGYGKYKLEIIEL